ncbi:hypothetical protein QYE76_047677 [Lolium multiflorum]|uniref:RNase H type-1 domain-containing protein n=1 Tax=Lolium multiflorum TaxID=4521 RepID=A0AAD8TP86_LOLMU|nr:hypothetical protein QYE76_047677 [Lolium multiflorum]
MNFDGSKRLEGAGAGVILISPQGDKLKYVLWMTFPNASNNEAEYEALIHGMKMAKACGTTRLKIFGNSQLVAQQVMNQCDVVNDSMIAYKEVYNELEKLFDGCEVNHISRLRNEEADVLANIGSQCLAIPPGVFWEEISKRSTKPKKQQKKEKEEKPLGAKEISSGEEDEPEWHQETSASTIGKSSTHLAVDCQNPPAGSDCQHGRAGKSLELRLAETPPSDGPQCSSGHTSDAKCKGVPPDLYLVRKVMGMPRLVSGMAYT